MPMRSLERHLLAWVLGAFVLGAVLLAGVAYQVVRDEMEEVFDENLRQVALALASHSSAGLHAARPPLPALEHGYEEHADFDFVTEVFDRDGRLLSSSDTAAHPPPMRKTGLSDVVDDHREWRVYTIVLGDRIVQAAQRESSRGELAFATASEMLLPLALFVPVIGVLLVLALRRGLMPLGRAATDIAARSVPSLEPIDAVGTPREIDPLIDAINGLMARLSVALAGQRRFIADAAHELRTPITALRLQLQLLDSAANDAERDEASTELALGVERAQRLIEQMLDLSRVEPDAPPEALERVDLAALLHASSPRWTKAAERQRLALSVDVDAGVVLQASAHQIEVLIDNLVANAIRYGSAGSSVAIRAAMTGSGAVLSVVDDGPGMTARDRERAFDRFFRGASATRDGASAGSGLGLSIVRAIAERHGATATLHVGPGGRGLEARIVFAP